MYLRNRELHSLSYYILREKSLCRLILGTITVRSKVIKQVKEGLSLTLFIIRIRRAKSYATLINVNKVKAEESCIDFIETKW